MLSRVCAFQYNSRSGWIGTKMGGFAESQIGLGVKNRPLSIANKSSIESWYFFKTRVATRSDFVSYVVYLRFSEKVQ